MGNAVRYYTDAEIANIQNHFYYKDGHLFWKDVRFRREKGPLGTLNSRGYLTLNLRFLEKPSFTTVHRIVWVVCYGENAHGQVDHINGCRIDNRLENLRVCSRSQNRMNSRPDLKTKHTYKGITDKKSYYEASITKSGKKEYLGSSSNPKEAALIYNYAAERLFASYARFNKVFEDVEKGVLSGET